MKLRDLFGAEDRSALEKWCRAHTQQAYVGDHRALCRVLGKFLMYVDTRDLSLAPHLLLNGYWEMWVTQAIVDYVKPGMRCIDVGANFGYYTLLLKELAGDKGSVTAYEPQPRVAELLIDTLMINGGDDICHPVAASDYEGMRPLFLSNRLMGSASLRFAEGLMSPDAKVFCARLDENHEHADFVKVDAQGHELEVLRGMKGLIERSPKIAVALEFTPADHVSPLDALREIQGMGFPELRSIGTDGQVRAVTIEDAVSPDTGDHRMLWLQK